MVDVPPLYDRIRSEVKQLCKFGETQTSAEASEKAKFGALCEQLDTEYERIKRQITETRDGESQDEDARHLREIGEIRDRFTNEKCAEDAAMKQKCDELDIKNCKEKDIIELRIRKADEWLKHGRDDGARIRRNLDEYVKKHVGEFAVQRQLLKVLSEKDKSCERKDETTIIDDAKRELENIRSLVDHVWLWLLLPLFFVVWGLMIYPIGSLVAWHRWQFATAIVAMLTTGVIASCAYFGTASAALTAYGDLKRKLQLSARTLVEKRDRSDRNELDAIDNAAKAVLRTAGLACVYRNFRDISSSAIDPSIPFDARDRCLTESQVAYQRCTKLGSVRLLNLLTNFGTDLWEWMLPYVVCVGIAWVLNIVVIANAMNWTNWFWLSIVCTMLLLVAAMVGVTQTADREVYKCCRVAVGALDDAEYCNVKYQMSIEPYKQTLNEADGRYETELQKIQAEHLKRIAEFDNKQSSEEMNSASVRKSAIETARRKHDQSKTEAERLYCAAKEEEAALHQATMSQIIKDWEKGLNDFKDKFDDASLESRSVVPILSVDNWSPRNGPPAYLRLGDLSLSIVGSFAFHSGSSLIGRGPEQLTFPALIPLSACSCLFKATGIGRAHAVNAIQSLMFQLVTLVPPGKLRFTIIDPVSLGSEFAGFMHLRDYDDSLVTGKIWTQERHIEEQLINATEHMETVIQKYLRNEYQSIEEYNRAAAELGEPYRVLVITSFPTKFSDTSATELINIMSAGQRCGVFTMLIVDTAHELPEDFNLNDLERQSNVFSWDGDRFVWDNSNYSKHSLTVESPPSDTTLTGVLKVIGQAVIDGDRVEVPFDRIIPATDQLWHSSAIEHLSVPVGTCGAKKIQNVDLGYGTAQHILVAGKTGSGKSSFLHALVTNACLMYSPNELELYLVDYKKGVEFKTYATYELPHAAVIAIESEREFGLSVLERLDQMLTERGELFRIAEVQDLGQYRRKFPDKTFPRCLLVVDEFHELFADDDRISQSATNLLNRLARQGRAFGIHVLLGSQTISGSHSIPKSILGQFGVRIALQCNESDSREIFTDDNTAARLLSRPGEAVYNGDGGKVEANSPFQVAWMQDDERRNYLEQIQQLSKEYGFERSLPQIVFEGNVSAKIENNKQLEEAANGGVASNENGNVQCWLGEPVAIKAHTSCGILRRSGSNLLIVGEQDRLALATMISAVFSLASQLSPRFDGDGDWGGFYVFDGYKENAECTGVLSEIASRFPHRVHTVKEAQFAPTIRMLAGAIEKRSGQTEKIRPNVYLIFFGLADFRELYVSRDVPSYFEKDADNSPSVSEMFKSIVRKGPSVGVHTLAWCDSLRNLDQLYDYREMDQFAHRVVFQMAEDDSHRLIGTSLAAKLGPLRGYYYYRDRSIHEKFRPYAIPTQDWRDLMLQRINSKWDRAAGSRAHR